MTSLADLYQRNRAGDLEAIPVQQEDPSTWWERFKAHWASGGWQDPQPGQRGTFVPSRITDQGKAEPAVPGIIQQPAEGLAALMTAPLSDIVRSGDRDAIRAAAEASFDVASMLPAAGVAAGRTIPEGAAGIFGGRLAKTADHAALKRAEAMEKDGFSRNDIRRDTGWFKDAGGNWRFEIDDSGASFGKGSTVGQALNHPALFDAYPQLKNTPVEPMQSGIATGKYVPRYKGALGGLFERFVGPSNKIGVSPDAKKPTMLHEVQHAVDDLEGSLANLNTANPYAGTTYNGAWFEDSARRVADRADMTPEQRAARAPWLDTKLPAPKAKETPQQITTRDDLPVLPERQALEDALASMGLNPNDRYMQALIDGLKGQLDTGAADRYNSLEQIAGMVNSDASRKFGKALSDYRAKAQQIGHNGGPATSTWDQPFVYSNPNDPTTAAILALLTQQEKPSAGLVGKAKGARPEPDALIPKAEAMGADVAPQGRSSGSIAETAATDYTQFVRSLQDDPQSEPTIGMPTPGVDPSAVRAAYENGLRRWHSGFGKHATETPDPLGSLDGPLGNDLGAVMDSLRAAAKVAGRDLEVLPRSYGSQYGHLKTPTGDAWKVRVADHGNQSRHRAESDFNIAPGQMTVEEFLGLLPRIYANSSDPTTAAILALLTAQQGAPPQQ